MKSGSNFDLQVPALRVKFTAGYKKYGSKTSQITSRSTHTIKLSLCGTQVLHSPLSMNMTVDYRGNITRVLQLAAAEGWAAEFARNMKGQSRNGIWIHTSELHRNGVRVSTGSGLNTVKAQDNACKVYLQQNGYAYKEDEWF